MAQFLAFITIPSDYEDDPNKINNLPLFGSEEQQDTKESSSTFIKRAIIGFDDSASSKKLGSFLEKFGIHSYSLDRDRHILQTCQGKRMAVPVTIQVIRDLKTHSSKRNVYTKFETKKVKKNELLFIKSVPEGPSLKLQASENLKEFIEHKDKIILKYLEESTIEKMVLYSFICKKIEEEIGRSNCKLDVEEFIRNSCENQTEEYMKKYLNDEFYIGPLALLLKLSDASCGIIACQCRNLLNQFSNELLDYLSNLPRDRSITQENIQISAFCARDFVSELMSLCLLNSSQLADSCITLCREIQKYLKPKTTKEGIDMFSFPPMNLIQASRGGFIDQVNFLIQQSWVDVNSVENDSTALSAAASSKKTDIVKLLLNHPDIDVNKSQPLNCACRSECEEIVDLLLERKEIDVNGSLYLSTSLSFACSKGNISIVAKLLTHNPDLYLDDPYKQASKFPEIQTMLINHGYQLQ